MGNQRVFLVLALLCIGFLMYEAWETDYGQTAVVPDTRAGTGGQVSSYDPVIPDVNSVSAQTPDELDIPKLSSTINAEVRANATQDQVVSSSRYVTVKTDLLTLKINLSGGTISYASLPAYPLSLEEGAESLVLLQEQSPEFYVAQSGLISETHGHITHQASFTAQQDEYSLDNGQPSFDVVLTHRQSNGVVAEKIYTFHRGKYVIDLRQRVLNGTNEPWRGRQYTHLVRTDAGSEMRMVPTFTGGVIYNSVDKYDKVSFDDMAEDPLKFEADGGWAAIIQHYFVTAWVPAKDQAHAYYAKQQKDGRYRIGMASADFQVPAGDQREVAAQLYIGPKLQDALAEVAEGLELTVDYGMLTVISKPLFILLSWIHSFVGNWGWSIILLTVLLKLVFFKLSETSYRSMAGMRKLQPKMTKLRERYGDDKERMKTAMMQLYREEKINPIGGCLPILVQIPVFLALYWVLLESVELRQAPFMLWIHDLSVQDPYFILPVLMGLSMLIQQKLNPTPVDPMQAKIMMILPIVFTFFFLFFPAGLVLYWVVNNTLSISQQWVIMKRVDRGE